MLGEGGGVAGRIPCAAHQSTRLMIEALGFRNLSNKVLMQHAVCDVLSRECIMGECESCEKCSGEAGVRAYLHSLSDVPVRYFHLESADRRCTVEWHLLPLDDFLVKLSYELSRLTRHHFTYDHQSKYFDSLIVGDPLCPDSTYVLGMYVGCVLCCHCQGTVCIIDEMGIREWCIRCGNKDFLAMPTFITYTTLLLSSDSPNLTVLD